LSYFHVKNFEKGPSKSEDFFSPNRSVWLSKNPEFMSISDRKKSFRKNAPKKVKTKNICFSGDLSSFLHIKTVFWDYHFLVHFFSMIPSDLKSA
jgi:hypothetical protein